MSGSSSSQAESVPSGATKEMSFSYADALGMKAPLKRNKYDEDALQQRPLKKERSSSSEPEEPEWRARFAQCVMLKAFCDNISNILAECYFEVIFNDDPEAFSGFSVESIDANRACIVQGRLSGQVTVRDSSQTQSSRGFCIRMANLISCLRSVHACHFLDVWQPRNSSDVLLKVYEPNVSNYAPEFTLKTLAKENDCQGLEGLVYNLFVEIDLDTFRNAVKTARDHKAEILKISVYQPKEDPTKPAGGPAISFFVIAYEGDEVSSKFPYQSSTERESEEEPLVIRANDTASTGYEGLPPLEDLNVIFNDTFGVEHLFLFVRSMERHVITLRLGQNQPLLLDFPMGCGRNDYIRFVLAPKTAP
jgi:hypothetical protein